jgi:hypothetical protein
MLPGDKLISRYFSVDDINEAIQAVEREKMIRSVICFWLQKLADMRYKDSAKEIDG